MGIHTLYSVAVVIVSSICRLENQFHGCKIKTNTIERPINANTSFECDSASVWEGRTPVFRYLCLGVELAKPCGFNVLSGFVNGSCVVKVSMDILGQYA